MLTTIEIREQILTDLRTSSPDFLWETGEPLVDILDSVSELHYKREFIVELGKSLNKVEGFRRLINDSTYRQNLSTLLSLSLTTRTKTWVGVPFEVTNDVDAFIYYYLDRFGETRGIKRGKGTVATGICYLNYPAAVVAGDVIVIFKISDKVYKLDITLNGDLISPTTRQVVGTIYSMGYGSKFNVPANNVKITGIYGAITNTALVSFNQLQISGGTDYEASSKYLERISNVILTVSGLATRSNIASIINSVDGIDKYKVRGVDANRRFKGSSDVIIKGSVTQQWEVTQIIPDDKKVLVRYQPSTVLEVTFSGTALIENTDYYIETLANDYEHSCRQVTYLNFEDSVTVTAGDTIVTKLLVDFTCVEANRLMNQYYSTYYESARDWNVYQAQNRNIDFELQIQLANIIDTAVASSLIDSQIRTFVGNLQIEADLEWSDIINSLYGIYYNGEALVDSVEMLSITDGTTTISSLGTMTLLDGECWNVQSISVVFI